MDFRCSLNPFICIWHGCGPGTLDFSSGKDFGLQWILRKVEIHCTEINSSNHEINPLTSLLIFWWLLTYNRVILASCVSARVICITEARTLGMLRTLCTPLKRWAKPYSVWATNRELEKLIAGFSRDSVLCTRVKLISEKPELRSMEGPISHSARLRIPRLTSHGAAMQRRSGH